MKFSRIIALFIVLMTLGIGSTTFAEPTATDLNIRGDAQGGVTREGYIDSFKS